MEKYIEYLNESKRKLRIADHLIYMTLPLVQEKRIYISILTEMNNSTISLMNSVLNFEKIKITKGTQNNFDVFFTLLIQKYSSNKDDIHCLKELLEISTLHKNSSVEIFDKKKVVILSEYLKSQTLTLEKIKKFDECLKLSIDKVTQIMSNSLQVSNK